MKAKYIYKCLMISFAALLLGSCSSPEVDSKFDQNATERLSGRQKELNDLLLSSAEGWKAVYYTDSTQLGGWTHLFKFLPEGKVDMASDFTLGAETDTKTYRSQYNIQVGSTVSLVFTTENRIHLLSNANDYPTAGLLAKGYLGDFQFYYYGQKNGDIIFRTNRNGHFLRFVKATPQDWADLPKNVPIINSITGDMTSPLFRLLEINDGTTTKGYDFDYNTDARFGTGYSLDPAVNTSYDLAFSFNPTGAYSKTPLEVKGQKLTDFLYNGTDNTFVATGKDGVKATIKYTNAPPIVTDDYKNFVNGKPQMVLGYIAANLYTASTTSDYFRFLITKVNATLPAAQSISRIQVFFNSAFGTYIEYRFNGGKPSIYHNLTTTENSASKTLVLVHDSWDDGSALIAAPAFLKDIDAQFTNPMGFYIKKENFKISFSNVIYTMTSASSSFRMTTYQL